VSEHKDQTIILIKKKVQAAGHHGGAWKVAYADFVTAMMAFFMVMWLMNSSEKVKQAVGGYFSNPTGSGQETGSGQAGAGEGINLKPEDMDNLKDKIEQSLKEMPAIEEMKDQVKMTVTGEGLRIELLETERGMFFESGSPNPSDTGEGMLAKLAAELGKLDNTIVIEGHTDARPLRRDGVSNWELSADRANAARRLMQESGLRADQVKQVRGFADQSLMVADDPEAPGNRRVSIIVQYKKAEAAAVQAAPAAEGAPATAPPEKEEKADAH
jgi:chemotaxis protein MotB